MDHGGHGGHDMPAAKCSMHMLWNTQIIDTCVVFRQWHITSYITFVVSLAIIVALGVLFEYLRAVQRIVDTRIALSLATAARHKPGQPRTPSPSGHNRSDDELEENVRLLSGVVPRRNYGRNAHGHALYAVPTFRRIIRALLYASTVFLSFFLMLVFMTYNAYLILAVVTGAGLGHYIFGSYMDVDSVLGNPGDGKGVACH